MITVRRSQDRGHFDHGWLDTRHTFSFADYHDPAHMGFRSLRVVNEDRVRPGQGFGAHPHRDMEIVSYVVSGALAHEDSMGNGSTIRPGDVQRMSAGTGVVLSEFNHSRSEPVHFLQIWILPAERGLPPGYEQKRFPDGDKRGRLRLVASPDGAERSVTVHQDARLYAKREKVRLIGIDAPELQQSPCGQRAKRYLSELVSTSQWTVSLEFDVEKRDVHGRLLSYVCTSDKKMINVQMLSEGYAMLYTFPPNIRYVDEFKKAQGEAREKGLGIWGKGGLKETPQEYRREHPRL